MKDSENGQILTNKDDIYRALRALEMSRSMITLRFGHDAHAFSSLLIHCDLERGHFIIDEVRPEDGNPRLKQGEPFTLIAFYDGIQVMMKDGRVKTSKIEGFANAYAIEFPQQLYHKQRRQVFRAPVTRDLSSQIELKSEKRTTALKGRIVDISPLGIGCEFSGFIKPELERGELFEDCLLNINAEFAINSALLVKHPSYNKGTDTTQCGFEFKDLDAPSQKALDRFILHLQRQARRVGVKRPA